MTSTNLNSRSSEINFDDNDELLLVLGQEAKLHLDPRSYLEVVDTKHRYAKNLRSYYSYFDDLNSKQRSIDANPNSGTKMEMEMEIAVESPIIVCVSASASNKACIVNNDNGDNGVTFQAQEAKELLPSSSPSTAPTAAATISTHVVREDAFAAYPSLSLPQKSSSSLLFSSSLLSNSANSSSSNNNNINSVNGSNSNNSNNSNSNSEENGDDELDRITPNELKPKFKLFFQWLDGPSLPEVAGIGRRDLDEQTVVYINDDAGRAPYLLHIQDSLLYTDVVVEMMTAEIDTNSNPNPNPNPIGVGMGIGTGTTANNESCCSSSKAVPVPATERRLVNTGKDGFIYVMRDQRIYIAPKVNKKFHHSSFFGGRDVESSGFMVIEQGVLKSIIPHSGHYRPKQDFHMLYLLAVLKKSQIDLDSIDLDTQRINKQPRALDSENKKMKKLESLNMEVASSVYYKLKHKYKFYKQSIATDLLHYIIKDKVNNADKYIYDDEHFTEIGVVIEDISPRSSQFMLFNKVKADEMKGVLNASVVESLLTKKGSK